MTSFLWVNVWYVPPSSLFPRTVYISVWSIFEIFSFAYIGVVLLSLDIRLQLLNNRIDNSTLATKEMPTMMPSAAITPSFLSDFDSCVTNGLSVDVFSVDVIFSVDVVGV